MNKFKNIVTNLIGFIFFGIAIYESLSETRSISFISLFIVIALLLFRYKWEETKGFLDKFFNRVVNDENITASKTVDGEIKEKPDTRG